ncbi:MAG: K(+)-transporting ATPase subunit F, partial [Nitrospirae bacterium]|nr:K(+)-transporting ATPase subunit F [Nitrospirota bacterium]
ILCNYLLRYNQIPADTGVIPVLSKFMEVDMENFYWIGGIVSIVLLVYLTVALLKPEVF